MKRIYLRPFLPRLISRRRRGPFEYHFIHIPKNGGQSVRAALMKRRDVSLITPLHSRYIDVVDLVGTDVMYFCIVRNPWSRTASRYQFVQQGFRKWPIDDPRRRYIEKASFADFVREQKTFEIPEHPGQPWMGPMNSWFNQLDWIADRDGRVRGQCLRLEVLNEDLTALFGEAVNVPRENVTKAQYDYRAMYTTELIEIVARTFKRDIDHFGFDFEGTAIRNFIGAAT